MTNNYGRNLPKHELMQNLFRNFNENPSKTIRKTCSCPCNCTGVGRMTKSTQTTESATKTTRTFNDLDLFPRKGSKICDCNNNRSRRSLVQDRVRQFNNKIESGEYKLHPTGQARDVISLMESIRKNIDVHQPNTSNCASDCTEWSDEDTNSLNFINLPKETRNSYYTMCYSNRIHQKQSFWPGFAERLSHNNNDDDICSTCRSSRISGKSIKDANTATF